MIVMPSSALFSVVLLFVSTVLGGVEGAELRRRSGTSCKPRDGGAAGIIKPTLPAQKKTAVVPKTETKPKDDSGTGSQTQTFGGKAGMAINQNSGKAFDKWGAIPGSQIGWYYNWYATKTEGVPSNWEYVPILHRETQNFQSSELSFSSWGVKNVLSFNEPDQNPVDGGTGMSATDAAKSHIAVFTEKLHAKYKIGAPAVARGGKIWFEAWIVACRGQCIYDFVPIHFYGTDASDMIAYIKEFHDTYKKPIWVTEFACLEFGGSNKRCNKVKAEAFMKTVIDYMKTAESGVERWNWFGAFLPSSTDEPPKIGENIIMSGDGTANALGQKYAVMG